MIAMGKYFRACNVSVLGSATACCDECFDLANLDDACAASDWMKGWLDGRDRQAG